LYNNISATLRQAALVSNTKESTYSYTRTTFNAYVYSSLGVINCVQNKHNVVAVNYPIWKCSAPAVPCRKI